MNESFYIWTFAYDVSGMKSVTLYVREDADGVNPLDDFANEVRLALGLWHMTPATAHLPSFSQQQQVFHPEVHGFKGVGPWNAHPMLQRVFPKGNVYNESVDFTCNAR